MTTPPVPPPDPTQGLARDLTPPHSDTPEPGRLRVYLGAAPGVGKTYRMLEDAHLMRRQGVDIVIGLIEPHGRAETAALVEGLEIVSLQEIQYRSIILREMNLEAILARHPAWCIVDELAHTNVPGSRNHKRYEDVLELLDAGINVMTAMNVQHLETLNDAVARSASIQIRETVPDSFLRRADEVVNVDITIDELRDRLRQGKIYAPEKVEQALANFFRKGNLNMLRELALRATAEQVGAAAALRDSSRPPSPRRSWSASRLGRAWSASSASAPASPAASPPTGTSSTSKPPMPTIATAIPRPSPASRTISAWRAISALAWSL